MRVANIATYPAREDSALPALRSIASQVDVLNVAFNEYPDVPDAYRRLPNLNAVIPAHDIKDVGKFIFPVAPEDDVFLCDDDIVYPPNYVTSMMQARESLDFTGVIVGVHGVIYSDYFDGLARSGRLVHLFYRGLDVAERVNQLGTGTVHVKGCQMPPLKFMEGSSGFVDIRFARYAYEHDYPMFCVARETGWLRELENEEALHLGVTRRLPLNALHEVQAYSGLARLAPSR